MTYAELVQALKDFTQSDETTFVANIPLFVRQAEEKLVKAVPIPAISTSATITLPHATKTHTLPTGFLTPSLVVVVDAGVISPVLNRTQTFIDEAFPAAASEGRPRYYSISSGTQFIVGPIPDKAYTCEFEYFAKPTSIVTAGTSWYGTNAESALLYGSLIHAYVFLKGEPDLLATYRDLYKEALDQVKLQNQQIGVDENSARARR